ncbi:MAG TPA: acyl carrier protein [Opitutaceae bacterium]
MSPNEIEEKVRQTIAKKMNVDPATITSTTRLSEDLGVDSFGGVELMFELEEAFNLKIPDSDIQQIRTVNDIVVYLDEWLKKSQAKS